MYVYVSLGSMVMSPSLMVGLVLSLPIMNSLDFSWPNWILYNLLAVLFVIDSISKVPGLFEMASNLFEVTEDGPL